MDETLVTRAADALTLTTTPTDTMRFLCAGDETMPDVTDERLMPGDGPPLHRHPWATREVVVEGTLLVRLGDDDVEVGPGDLVYTPPNLVHTFVVTGDAPARLIGINWPGGFHRLYRELAEAFVGDGPPDFGAMVAAAARHDTEILDPPLAIPEGA
jgi:mannose-6-phosphate isomerase-like protein (cupin superfamily)